MTQPDLEQHLKLVIGGLVMELAAAKAVIAFQETKISKVETPKPDDARRPEP